MFWEEVEKFKQVKDEAVLKHKFELLYTTFIPSQADHAININASIRNKLTNVQNGKTPLDNNVFTEAQEDVYRTLESDAFFRYQKQQNALAAQSTQA